MSTSIKTWSDTKRGYLLISALIFSAFISSCSTYKNEQEKFILGEPKDSSISNGLVNRNNINVGGGEHFLTSSIPQNKSNVDAEISRVICTGHKHEELKYCQKADNSDNLDKNILIDNYVVLSDYSESKKDADEDDDSFSVANILSALGVIGAILNYLYTKTRDNRADIRGYRDEYWLRQVLFPVVIDSLKDITKDSRKALQDCNGAFSEFYSSYLLDKLNEISDNSILLLSNDRGFSEFIEAQVEVIEQRLTTASEEDNILSSEILLNVISEFVNEVFSRLDKIQAGNNQ